MSFPTVPLPAAISPEMDCMLENVAVSDSRLALTKSVTGPRRLSIVSPEKVFVMFSNMQSISGEIAAGKGTVGKLIYEDTFYNSALDTVSNLQSATDEIKVTVADARKVLEEVSAGQGTLGKLIKEETLYNQVSQFMTNMTEISEKINRGDGTIGKLVNDQEMYKNIKMGVQKLEKATD